MLAHTSAGTVEYRVIGTGLPVLLSHSEQGNLLDPTIERALSPERVTS